MKLKLKMFVKILLKIKKCLISAIILLRQNLFKIQKKLVLGKIKDETGGVAIEEFVGLKAKMYSFLVDIFTS